MENSLQPWVSWSFLQNNNHQAVKKMELGLQSIFHRLNKYIYKLIYIYLLICHIIALSKILSTLQIILHLVCHKSTEIVTTIHCCNIFVCMYL